MVPGSNSKLDKRVGHVEQQLTAVNDALAKITAALGVAEGTEVAANVEAPVVSAHPDIDAAEAIIINKIAANPLGGMMVMKGARNAESHDMYATRLGLLQDLRESRNTKYGATRKLR